MGRASLLLLAGLAALAGAAGCALCPRQAAPCPAEADEAPLAAVERGSAEAGILDLADALEPPPPPAEPPPAGYRALPLPVCQCLAAKHAPLADGLDRQRRQLRSGRTSCCLGGQKAEKQRAFQESMLLYSALEIRDQAAGTALEWYYQLAGAEAKTDLLDLSLKRGRDALARAEQLRHEGIRLPAPIEEYQRQLVELHLQRAQNRLTIEQLNGKLRLALGYDPMHPWRFWPDPGEPVGTETVPDVEAAVRLALEQRPQLLLLRGMIANLDRDTLDSARSLLGSLNPLMALSGPTGCKLLAKLAKVLHVGHGRDDEVERVRAQLTDYLRERERTVAAEVREAAYEVTARRELTVLAREAAGRWRQRVADLEKQHAEGIRGVAGLTSAYLDWYKARGEVVREFLAWKVAAVKLKQAQGILPAECGYGGCANDMATPRY